MRRRRSSCRASFRCAAAFSISFAPDADDPVRIELFGDEVESIRRFDVATQRSLETLEATTITMLEPTASDRAHFTAYSAGRTLGSCSSSRTSLQEEGKFYLERMDRPQAFHCGADDAGGDLQVSVGDGGGRAGGSMETTAHLEFESVERFSGDIAQGARRARQGERRAARCSSSARRRRRSSGWASCSTTTQLAAAKGGCTFVGRAFGGRVSRSCRSSVVLVSAAELFHRQDLSRTDAAAAGAGDRQLSGAARGRPGRAPGARHRPVSRAASCWRRKAGAEEHLELEYHGGTKIYVPSAQDRAGAEVRRRAKGASRRSRRSAARRGCGRRRRPSRRSPTWPPT